MSRFSVLLGIGVVFISGGCTTTKAPQPALLETADAGSMMAIEARLADAMGRARVQLGPMDLTANSVIPVLPPGLSSVEGRSTVTPVLFDLMIDGGQCILVRRNTGDIYPLENVDCVAAD